MPEPDAQHALRALTRRDVVIVGVVMGATVAVGSKATAEAPGPPWTAGTVASVGRGEVVLRPADGSAVVRVRLMPDAVVLKDAPARIEDFVPGEEIAVLGARGRHGQISASRLESTYRFAEGVVTERRSDRLVADGQELELTDQMRVRDASTVEAIGRGDEVSVRGLRIPRRGQSRCR